MAAITAPALVVQNIEWTLDRPGTGNTAISGNRGTSNLPWYGKWSAHVDLAVITGEANFAPVRSFLFRCQGQTNTFPLNATVEAQNANSGVTLSSAAAANDTNLSLAGATTPIAEGQMLTAGGQLFVATAAQSGASVAVQPPVRAAMSLGTAVETANPYATVRFASPDVTWSIEPPDRYSASFDVEEAF